LHQADLEDPPGVVGCCMKCGKFLVVSVVLSAFLLSAGKCFSAAADSAQARLAIISLIDNGKYAEAQSQTDKLIADFGKNPDLPETLYWIARKYGYADRHADGEYIYQQIIQNYPASGFADRARLGLASAGVQSLILSRDYNGAKAALNKLTADFGKNPDLPETLYWIARKYGYADRYADVEGIYRQIIQNYPESSFADRARLGLASAGVHSLILSGDYKGAETAVDKLIADFGKNPDLPETLYWIERKYGYADRYADVEGIYRQIIQNYPESSLADMARLGLASAGVQSLILSGDYEGAKTAVDKLAADFGKNPDLPETLYWIARKYGYADRYAEEKDIYQQIIRGHPEDRFADRARLDLAGVNVFSLLKAQDFAGAKAALNKMTADFSAHFDLPETLYWIAQKYGWLEKLDEEEAICRMILQKYPGSPYEEKVKLALASANVQSLILSGDYKGAKTAVDKLTADFGKNPDLPEMLYWIGERYEWSGKYEEAKNIHQQVISKFPESPFADKSRLGIGRADVLSQINRKDAGKAVDKFMSDFSKNADLPRAVLMMGQQVYDQGLLREHQESWGEAREYYEKAVMIWGKLADKMPASSLALTACYRAGNCYFQINKFEEARRCFEKIIENNSDNEFTYSAQLMIGRSYEGLKNTGAIDALEADGQIKAAYERVIASHSDSRAVEYAKNWLAANTEKEK